MNGFDGAGWLRVAGRGALSSLTKSKKLTANTGKAFNFAPRFAAAPAMALAA